jgi:hypothetical protein
VCWFCFYVLLDETYQTNIFLLICDCIFALIAAIIAYYRVKWTLLLQICVSIILILYAFSWYLRFKKKYIIQKRFHIMAHIFIIYFLTLM